jgi:hypothetical protein
MGAGPSLITAFDFVWDRFTNRSSGLTDDEYFWEPVPGCWTLRPDSTGRWILDGATLGPDPDLDPHPVTTIADEVVHHAAEVGLLRDLYGRLRS